LGAGGALSGVWCGEAGRGRREFHNTLHETAEIDDMHEMDEGTRMKGEG